MLGLCYPAQRKLTESIQFEELSLPVITVYNIEYASVFSDLSSCVKITQLEELTALLYVGQLSTPAGTVALDHLNYLAPTSQKQTFQSPKTHIVAILRQILPIF